MNKVEPRFSNEAVLVKVESIATGRIVGFVCYFSEDIPFKSGSPYLLHTVVSHGKVTPVGESVFVIPNPYNASHAELRERAKEKEKVGWHIDRNPVIEALMKRSDLRKGL